MTDSTTPEFLKDALKFGINLGLDRMNKLDEILGNPEESIKAVHIAGTNGKGSTAAYMSSILAASGKKVGIYTSPFLERFSERMRIVDGKEGLLKLKEDESYGEISEEDLKRLSSLVEAAASKMTNEGYEHPTEFELVTAICYLWFEENDVDVAVLETGLGGRLDSTNVVTNPLCTIVTAMGLDHTDRLGNTIEEIASEKAGIFKPQSPAFVSEPSEMILDSDSQEKVREVFIKKAKEVGTTVSFLSKDNAVAEFTSDGRMHFELDNKKYSTSLQGEHQISNAATAIKACKALGIDEEAISFGVANTMWKGRCEILSLDPVVIIDGGHNFQGATSLASTLNKVLEGSLEGAPLRAVFGVMKDKDVEGMLTALCEGGVVFEEVTAALVNNPRSMTPSELSIKIKEVYNDLVEVFEDADAVNAVSEAYSKSLEDGMPLLVTGSLYLLGQIRGELRNLIEQNEGN